MSISAFAEDIRERLQGKDTIVYTVSYNGMPSGYVVWRYGGKRLVNGRMVDILSVSCDTKILALFNLESDEDIMLDEKTLLPYRVERKVKLFGNEEYIKELYDQTKGIVTIERKKSHRYDELIRRNPPIHNILALLYFFPQTIELKDGNKRVFNLPTQKIEVTSLGTRSITTKDKKKIEAYALRGKGARRFNLWLDVIDRMPLRLEFIVPLGRIVIERKDSPPTLSTVPKISHTQE